MNCFIKNERKKRMRVDCFDGAAVLLSFVKYSFIPLVNIHHRWDHKKISVRFFFVFCYRRMQTELLTYC